MKKNTNPTAVITLSDQNDDLVNLRVNPDHLSFVKKRKPDFFIHVHPDGRERRFSKRPAELVTSVWVINDLEVAWLQTREFSYNRYPINMDWPEGVTIASWSGPPFGIGWRSYFQTGIWWRPVQKGGL